jgi:hypothetical protein
MFRQFGPAPLRLDLDFDTFEGPPHFVSRFRKRSGWLLVAEVTIQSRYELLSQKVVVACDEHEQPVPSFQARHLTECTWSNACECTEEPPEILDDLLCEEEGALIVRWHRERNTALAETHERQLARIEAIEGKAKALIRRNDHRIADLRRRRRHPNAAPEQRAILTSAIAELEAENDVMIAEMAETRALVRRRAEEQEERLWSRADILVESEPLHLMQWSAARASSSPIAHPAPPFAPAATEARTRHRLRSELQGLLIELDVARKERRRESSIKYIEQRVRGKRRNLLGA